MMHNEPLPPIVVTTLNHIVVGNSVDAGYPLLHQSVSSRHAKISRDNSALVLEDLGSECGTFVNGTRVDLVELKPGDRVEFGSAPAFRVAHDKSRFEATEQGAQLRGQNLTLWHVSYSKGTRELAAKDLNFKVEANLFVGILGPSGCGKSTLLDVFATYNKEYDGSFRVDDEFLPRLEESRYCQIISHVPQTDLIEPDLTVRESLEFAAELRGVDRRYDVERVLNQIEMNDHADKFCYLLSNGQKKRLCVGYAMLRRPRLLLLDEPTGGLDPGMECNLMARFRRIAIQGTTVICTTHNMENIHLFDHVIVLGNYCCPDTPDAKFGKIAFEGPPGDLPAAMGCGNFTDIFLKLEQKKTESEGNDHDLGANSASSLESRAAARVILEANDSSLRIILDFMLRTRDQTACLLRRSWSKIYSKTETAKWNYRLRVLQPIALGILTSLTQFRTSKEFNVNFFCVISAIFLGMNNSLPDLVRERQQYVREKLAGLNRGSYLAAKVLMQWGVGLAQLLILLLTVVIVGFYTFDQATLKHLFVHPGASSSTLVFIVCDLPIRFTVHMSVLFLSYAGGVAVGMLVSTFAKTEQAALFWLPMLIMPQLLLSAVATGVSDELYSGDRPFRPLKWIGPKEEQQPTNLTRTPAVIVDGFSFVLFSRPAAILLDPKASNGKWDWTADARHLVLLVLVAYVCQYFLFCHREKMWQPSER